jgi:hypothetical protein
MNEQRTFGVEVETHSNIRRSQLADKIQTALYNAGFTEQRCIDTGVYTNDTDQNNFTVWKVKPDGSLTPDSGIPVFDTHTIDAEVVSPILKGRKGLKMLKVVLATIEPFTKISRRCGVHVHHGVTEAETTPLALAWMNIEDVFMQTLPKSRRNNIYCRTWKYRGARKERMDSHHTGLDFWNIYLSDRRTNLNFSSYSLRKTVEFRCAGGSTDFVKIGNWIVATQAVVENATNLKEVNGIHELVAKATTRTITTTPTPLRRPTTRRRGKSVFGHKTGSAKAFLDDMLAGGVRESFAVHQLKREFGDNLKLCRTTQGARGYFRGHLKNLRDKGWHIDRVGAHYTVSDPFTGPVVDTTPETPTPTTRVEADHDYGEALAWLTYRYYHFKNGANRIAA